MLLRADPVAVFRRVRAVNDGKRRRQSVSERAVFHPAVGIIGKADLGPRENEAGDHIGDIALFRAVRFEEFQSCGRVEKQIFHRHASPVRAPFGDDLAEHAARAGKRERVRIRRLGDDLHAGHGSNGSDRLAAEPER